MTKDDCNGIASTRDPGPAVSEVTAIGHITSVLHSPPKLLVARVGRFAGRLIQCDASDCGISGPVSGAKMCGGARSTSGP